MTEEANKLTGPDLATGIPLSAIADGAMVLGHAHGEPVLIARRRGELFAVSALCTHYNGPLAEGLLVDDTIRCPWHHACFSLRTGEAVRPPALNPVSCWRIERLDGKVFVRERLDAPTRRQQAEPMASAPESVIVLGGGGAGAVAAETLRREGYPGPITMVSADDTAPYDRPNLSKDYLAGAAPAEWMPLHSAEFYRENAIDLRLNAQVVAIDTAARQVQLENGGRLDYGAMLLATGAEPTRLTAPGAESPHIHYLRSFADSRALIASAAAAQRAVVIGASFIGLEVAASLRVRNIEVHVVAPENCPMERVLGPELGRFIRTLHEEHGVVFHLGTTVASIDGNNVTLENGEILRAELIVVGIGVRPVTAMAERAGLMIDRGVVVDEYLETSAPGIFAAGDIARWPDRLSGDRIRVEHWVVAERQGQTAARNMLGRRERFDAVPFFWSQHYDVVIAYVGHAERWDDVRIDGGIDSRDCAVTYRRAGRKLAVATIYRDLESLRAELAFETAVAP